jgi:hypothetical protein
MQAKLMLAHTQDSELFYKILLDSREGPGRKRMKVYNSRSNVVPLVDVLRLCYADVIFKKVYDSDTKDFDVIVNRHSWARLSHALFDVTGINFWHEAYVDDDVYKDLKYTVKDMDARRARKEKIQGMLKDLNFDFLAGIDVCANVSKAIGKCNANDYGIDWVLDPSTADLDGLKLGLMLSSMCGNRLA